MNRHLGIGWEFVHVRIDDTSRVAFVRVRANQRKEWKVGGDIFEDFIIPPPLTGKR